MRLSNVELSEQVALGKCPQPRPANTRSEVYVFAIFVVAYRWSLLFSVYQNVCKNVAQGEHALKVALLIDDDESMNA